MSRSRRGAIALKPRTPTYQHWWKALANRTMRTRTRHALKAGRWDHLPWDVREVADIWHSPADECWHVWRKEAEWRGWLRWLRRK